MHSSVILASLFAALAVASPVQQLHKALHKKAIVWDITTEIVYVTVTAGQEPDTVTLQKTVVVKPVAATTTTSKKSRRPRPTTTSSPPPPPPPSSTTTTTTTTTTPPPPPPSTTSPAPPPPAPTTTEAPVVVESSAAPAPQSTTAAVVEAPSSSSGDVVKDAALNYHNSKRALHHVGSVSWDDALAADAATLAQSCTNQHAIYGSYGQNIAASAVSTPGSASDDLAKIMTDAASGWYNEVNQFSSYGASDVSDSGVLHFTQFVWKATTKIGCAVNYCGTQGNIFKADGGFTFYAYTIVCNYQVAGNVAGQYADNVLAP